MSPLLQPLGNVDVVEALTSTLSYVAVARAESSWLESTRPTSIVDPIAMVSLPTSVQLVPLPDTYAENVLPLRTIRTHSGAVPLPPLVFVDAPPVVVRRWKARPLPGVTNMDACIALAESDARIITPAFVQAFVLLTLATRAVTVPSPVIVSYAKW